MSGVVGDVMLCCSIIAPCFDNMIECLLLIGFECCSFVLLHAIVCWLRLMIVMRYCLRCLRDIQLREFV